MNIQMQDIYDILYSRFEEDELFFRYYKDDGTPQEPEFIDEIAKKRWYVYILDAIALFQTRCLQGISITISSDKSEIVIDPPTESLSLAEQLWITEASFYFYLERKRAKLKPMVELFTSTELKALHSPAAERNSYDSMVNNLYQHLIDRLTQLSVIDRKTGKIRSVV